jgi:PIN domain nuclease of toxin-antitoxin system
MRLLLDTMTLLWWLTADARLPARTQEMLENPDNELLLSAASAWEIAIKCILGKLRLPAPAEVFVPAQMTVNGILPLSLELSHALRVETLPLHHRDPFDRMLVAQAQIEKLPIISNDPLIRLYDVDVLW